MIKITTVMPAALVVGLLGISACSVPAPYVSDFNGDSVTITVPLGSPASSACEIARTTCQRGGKAIAELASSHAVGTLGDTQYLFLCLD